MSATNHTANYSLSQYIGSDEPKYLTDYNSDMSKIDTAIKGAETKADTANTGVAANTSAIGSLDTAVSSLQTQVATVADVANGNTGSINTINSLIGNGEPTTTDKTIIGAINEIDAKIVDPSGLETRVAALETGVQGLGTDVESIESEIGNTALPTAAQTLTGAIAEIAQGGSTGGADLNFTLGGAATVTGSGASIGDADVRVLLNAAKSIGKIYGAFRFVDFSHTGAAAWTKVATISQSDLPTISEAYYIYLGYFFVYQSAQSTALDGASTVRLKFNTDGTVDVEVFMQANSSIRQGYVNLTPCIYILKDLGD